MEKDVALGSVGELKVSLVAGKALLSVSAGGDVADVSVSVDALKLLDLLAAEVASKLPASAAPIEASVWGVVKAAVAAIG